jgi:V8-like Glu-specific endopeptidase
MMGMRSSLPVGLLGVAAAAAGAVAMGAAGAGCGSQSQGPGATLPSFHDLPSAPAAIQQAAEAVVRIQTATESATGSFISSGGLLLTNNHVLGTEICPVEGCYATLSFDYQRGKPAQTGQTLYVVPTAVSVGLDMALVQVLSAPGGAPFTPPAFLSVESRDLASLMGTHVTLVGHPEGHLKKWTDGDVVDSDGDWMYTSAYLLPGNSGSPILDDAGNLVGIVHRGPSGQDYYTGTGAVTFSIGTPSALLVPAMSAPLPPEMISVKAPTTSAALAANDTVYLNARVASAPLAATGDGGTGDGGTGTGTGNGTIDVLDALATACDAALAASNYPTPEALSSAQQPCMDALSWIECRSDAGAGTGPQECPLDPSAWQARFGKVNDAWVALNGQTQLYPVSFGAQSLASTKADGIDAGSAALLQTLNAVSEPLDLGVANYLAVFGIPSYAGTQTVPYVLGYAKVADYPLQATDAASAVLWLLQNGLVTRDEAVGVLKNLYGDASVDVGTKLYLEDVLYQSGELP